MNSFSIRKDIGKFIKSLSKEEKDKVDTAIEMLAIKISKKDRKLGYKITPFSKIRA